MAVSKKVQRAGVRAALRTICYNLGVQQVRPTSEDSEALVAVLGPEIGATPHARPAGEQVQNAIACLTLAILREGAFAELPAAKAGAAKKGGKGNGEEAPDQPAGEGGESPVPAGA